MRAFVTGAGGFIGSHLVEALLRRGDSVRALVRYNSRGSLGWLDESRERDHEQLEVLAGDVRDSGQMRRAVDGCDMVFHLAALIGIPYSYQAARSYVQTNVSGTLNVLEAAREAGVERFLHTSTSEVYGSALNVPIDESHPLQPQSPYSATKIGADQLALSYCHSFDLPVTVVRPFNTYGPRQSARAVIPTIITQMLAGPGPVRLGSTHPTRDFTYVDDTVRGFLALAGAAAGAGEVFNLGTGFEISIAELVALIADIVGVEPALARDDARVRPEGSEVDRLLSDNNRVREVAGWRPALGGRDGLRAGLERTVEWFSDPSVRAAGGIDAYAV
ncbi:MAG: SDR family NAD(P)-dependent oxidoreductase [Gemmatimonadota bacterium]